MVLTMLRTLAFRFSSVNMQLVTFMYAEIPLLTFKFPRFSSLLGNNVSS